MTKKQIKKIINQVPVGYYQCLNVFQKWWHRGKFQAIKKVLENEKPRSMLDLGCNDGTMTARIAGLFPNVKKVTAIDLFAPGIKFARKLYPWIDFQVGDIQDFKLQQKYDLVTCLETIEHITNPEKLLRQVENRLKKDGIVIIEMDSGNLLFKLMWFVWTRLGGKVWRGAHLWKANKKELHQLLEKSNLKIVEIKTFNLGMGVVFKLKK